MALPLYKKSKLEKLFPRSDSDTNLQNYNKIRSELQTGDFLFFSGDHWLSSLIRSRSRSAWSHVGIVIKLEELDRVFLVESVLENGIRMVPMSFVFKDYDGAGKPYVGRVGWARHTEIGSDPKSSESSKNFVWIISPNNTTVPSITAFCGGRLQVYVRYLKMTSTPVQSLSKPLLRK